MTRRAILVAPSSPTEAIPGTHDDLEAIRAFLMSNLGGAWMANELVCVEDSDPKAISGAIDSAKGVDFSLIYFAGQGEFVKTDVPWREMRITLDAGKTITERDLNPGSPSCVLILDCARRPTSKIQLKSLLRGTSFIEFGGNSLRSRAAYEESATTAESGLVKIYSVDSRGDNASVHSFTQHLLYQTFIWGKKNKGILPLDSAVNLAAESMAEESAKGRPEYLGGRRLAHFPFAVKS